MASKKIVLKKKRGFDAARLVAEQFKSLRMAKPDRPITKDGEILEPRVPHDLTILTDQALGRLYSEFGCMAQYCQASLGWLESQKLLDKRAARLTRSEAKVMHQGRVATLEAHVDLDHKTRTKEDTAVVSEAVATITNAMLASYIIGKDVCSREIARRQGLRELTGPTKLARGTVPAWRTHRYSGSVTRPRHRRSLGPSTDTRKKGRPSPCHA